MSTDRLISTIPCYKKIVAFLVSIFFSLALVGIALDQHFQSFSKSCLICQTKSSIKGLEAYFTLDFYPKIAFHFFNQFLLKLPILDLLPSQNKSPPQINLIS
jgi:hypothetical protein